MSNAGNAPFTQLNPGLTQSPPAGALPNGVTFPTNTGIIVVETNASLASPATVSSSSLTSVGLSVSALAGHIIVISGLANNALNFPFAVGVEANAGTFNILMSLGATQPAPAQATVGSPASITVTSTTDTPFLFVIHCVTNCTVTLAASASGGSTIIEAGASAVAY